MSDGAAWQGNIKARLYEWVRERGYDSLTAFAESRPAVPLYVLADEMGNDVAAVQILSGLITRRSTAIRSRAWFVTSSCASWPRDSRMAGRTCWTTHPVSKWRWDSGRGSPTPP